MDRRLLDVTARTTFDFLDARLRTATRETDAVAVLDVTRHRESPDEVALQLEVDAADLAATDGLSAHVDEARLTPAEARTLAEELAAAADAAEAGTDPGGGRV
ncbi:DUF6360 family protein [Haloparvum sedimenti]|uniref:DUF6360 family protein n=1 Tax=Haloparvum sedimenti TaxID=1678448 RepID=UPI00071E906E|nr:DUF6360 family protein [Haloparvum sedimenti]